MVKVAFVGLGKMGGAAARVALQDEEVQVVAGVERNAEKESWSFPVFPPEKLEEAVKDAEVIVDFTNAESATSNVVKLLGMGKKVVVGTTGFNQAQRDKIENAVKEKNAVALIASNFSIGVNLFFKFAGEMAAKLPEYDVEVIEWHHNQKKDAPSGTAATVAKVLQEARGGKDKLVYGREGLSPRSKDEIGVHAVRAGGIVGIHSIWFVGNGEEIELRHSAHSRDCFARGCVKAIKWIGKQNAGGKIYSMKEVIGI
ncbi:4-hydroxy-tetrahydrodipicolinate reductase [Candidatus Micrarchaeota archaeon]|nr:4-hydroxy-tetrahydrodipicolinate reductase [Candidatus Micrarchaeota archaeon]